VYLGKTLLDLKTEKITFCIDDEDDILRAYEAWNTVVSLEQSSYDTCKNQSHEPRRNMPSESSKILTRDSINFCGIDDQNLRGDEDMIIIVNPNNIEVLLFRLPFSSMPDPLIFVFQILNRHDLLEKVEALCFISALREIPVVIINPELIATAWNSFATPPLLLSDFAEVFFLW
jgi:hypothetical protein